jgi:hypothetical protein
MSVANLRLSDYTIEDEFYDRTGELVMLELKRLADAGAIRYVKVDELWSNDTHNQIMDYLWENNVEPRTFQMKRAYLNVKCIVTLREARDYALSELAMDRESINRDSAAMVKAKKHDINMRCQFPEDLSEVDDLSNTIANLEEADHWNLDDWDVSWRLGLEKTKKKKFIPYGSSKK